MCWSLFTHFPWFACTGRNRNAYTSIDKKTLSMTHQICQESLHARMAWGHPSQQTTPEVLLVGRALLLNGELAPYCPRWPQTTPREDETKYIPPNFEASGNLPFLQQNWRKKNLTQTSCLNLGGTLNTRLLFSLVPELMLVLEQRHLSQENFQHILHISATNYNKWCFSDDFVQ